MRGRRDAIYAVSVVYDVMMVISRIVMNMIEMTMMMMANIVCDAEVSRPVHVPLYEVVSHKEKCLVENALAVCGVGASNTQRLGAKRG